MITPTERARLVIRHAFLAGSGAPITRADVLATLVGSDPVTPDRGRITSTPVDPTPAPDGGSTSTRLDPAPQVDPDPAPTSQVDPGSTRITPEPTPITPGQAPDDAVSITAAATRLGVSVATIRRYCAPSSGRLIRVGSGVTRASLEALAATR
ncbi:helix-turn-helix domain-containing protein [Parafrankia discariae]|uniref:helix-turn-helix domain-containing protein n=1 Tax=Parafrankia discariae TaxID=365528 RepID=UPI00039D51D9|nr:helix-turn-helix domain-containing protein [Parafrankia discariae]